MLRPLLFRLPADTAHDLGKTALRWPAPWRLLAGAGDPDPRLATDLGGLALTSPIGLAPGFDKRGDLAEIASRLHTHNDIAWAPWDE